MTPANRIDAIFNELRGQGRKAFMPFLTAGYPDLDTTKELILELDRRGAHLLELGTPFSDSIADGPVIQSSFTDVLRRGQRVDDVFRAVAEVRPHTGMGLVSMVSYTIVFRRGVDRYLDDCRRAGFDGLIVPDLPVEESDALKATAASRDLRLVLLAAPTTPPQRRKRIVAAAAGFLYYISLAGTTGERRRLPPELVDQLLELKRDCRVPVCVGFGISRPEHVRMLAQGPGAADGVIVGSALVRRIADSLGQDRRQWVQSVGDFAAELIAALNQ